jgi:phenylacetate-coenzyme A ligase PaaK-like adenylate-forming protein
MMDFELLQKGIFNINNQVDFLKTALKVFEYQYNSNAVYRSFIQGLGHDVSAINSLAEIPFLPVELFRNHSVVSGDLPVETIFESSGTTGVTPGKHYINSLSLYRESFLRTFNLFYGNPDEYMIAALLPSYVERKGSSLVYMADSLIRESHNNRSGFYKDNIKDLIDEIEKAKSERKRVLLLGVTFALLDLAETLSPDLSDVIVMETGGMKGRRKELTRNELHAILKEKLNIKSIHSEYGMTELLSQAYSKGDGIFYCPPWMKILIRDTLDPLQIFDQPEITGGINIIDLANLHSCSFISTSDLGKTRVDDGFEVLGRFDNSDIRGCNLLIT